MSEEKEANPAGVKGTLSGWIKALVTSIVGLVSGAIIMYLTPVVNNVIKPAKPVSNFATQVAGLTVQFNNRSTGGVQGWWDFGDGTALEPFDPKAENIKHVYPKAGTYQVKLTLQNLLGEEGDRTASVTLDADTTVADGPAIDLFELKSLDRRERAPAVYKLTSKVKNANYCILSYGDNRPMEVIDTAGGQERYVTFDEMGSYTIRLAAVNGKQLIEKTQTIFVNPNESDGPIAKLQVVYEAVQVKRSEIEEKIYCGWPAGVKENVASFHKERPAPPGCTVLSAEFVNSDKDATVRNLKREISADKKTIVVTGDLDRAKSSHYLAHLKVVVEKRSAPQVIDRGEVAMAVNINGLTPIPMQKLEDGWEIVRKQVNLQLWDGTRKAWEGNQAVSNTPVRLNNQLCLVSMTPQVDGFMLKVDAAAAPPLSPLGTVTILPPPPLGSVAIPASNNNPLTPVGPIRPASYLRNPLLPKK
jgi:PKD repeat protein